MTNDFDYRYDSCISRGICSMNPRTSSLQEVLVLFLKASAHYALKLYENDIVDEKIKAINNITKEDIITVSKALTLDTIYFLKGDQNEKN